MKELEYPAEKKARLEINPRTVIPDKYHDLLDVFFKKTRIHSLHIENMIIKIY